LRKKTITKCVFDILEILNYFKKNLNYFKNIFKYVRTFENISQISFNIKIFFPILKTFFQ